MERLKRRTKDSLKMYRRHAGNCAEKSSKSMTACDCPLWCHGRLGTKRGRWALHTVALGTGEDRMRALLEGRKPQGPDDGGGISLVGKKPALDMTTAEAAERFFVDKSGLTDLSLRSYRHIIGDFRRFAAQKGVDRMRDISEELVRAYLEAHPWKPRTVRGKLSVLRHWFDKCAGKKWGLTSAPVPPHSGLMPSISAHARAALQPEAITAVLAAMDTLPFMWGKRSRYPREVTLLRVRVAILVMLYSGLRISDLTFLERAAVVDGVIDPICIKTGNRLGKPIRLPQMVLDALATLTPSRVYFFVRDRDDDYREARLALASKGDFIGTIGRKFARAEIQSIGQHVKRVLVKAGVTEGACHLFRHTFAVNYLEGKDADLEASIYRLKGMMGHASVRVTEGYLHMAKAYRTPEEPVLNYEFPA
jgi:site-specific recombinase XerD